MLDSVFGVWYIFLKGERIVCFVLRELLCGEDMFWFILVIYFGCCFEKFWY